MILRRRLVWLVLSPAVLGLAGLVWLEIWIERTDLPPLTPKTGVTVVDRNGALLRAYTVEDGLWRLPIALDQVDQNFLDMLIAYEDRRFYEHNGVDGRALLRATWQAAWEGRWVSGGSTLTMQVARLLEGSGTGRMRGKLRQIRVALALERELDKEEILALYMHLAPYGGNVEGVRAASLTWFGTEPRRLTEAQSALLVALPQAPEARRPDRFPQAAKAARDRVLSRAVRFTDLTEAQITWARAAPISTVRKPFPNLAPHVADRLRAAHPTTERHELTLDRDLQTRLETLAARVVEGQDARMSAAIMVLNHQTGALRASVGSARYGDMRRAGFVDMTQAIRSPGSTLKPLIFGLGFDQGLIHPQTRIEDRPRQFDGYAPENFDRVFRGEVSVAEALQLSLNLPAVALLDRLGPAVLLSAMGRAGMRTVLPEGAEQAGLAIALGGIGTRMEDLIQLYAALARGGKRVPYHLRQTATPKTEGQVISPVAAWYLANILANVTPLQAGRGQIAFKTGTSYGHRDAWAFGFDGRHVVGVWMGRADGAAVPGTFGAAFAAPVLFEAFARIDTALTPLPPPPTAALVVDLADLPAPLQHFGTQGEAAESSPKITFPPRGAQLMSMPGLPLSARVAEGVPPFTWLWNQRPVQIRAHSRQIVIADVHVGFGELTVIDAKGRSESLSVEIIAP